MGMNTFFFRLVSLGCLSLLALVYSAPAFAASCTWSNGSNLSSALDNCVPAGSVSVAGNDYTVATGIKNRMIIIANNLITIGGIVSVAGVVYGAILMVLSGGDDGKVKKGRQAVIYSLGGFLLMLLAYPLVNMTLNFFFSLG